MQTTINKPEDSQMIDDFAAFAKASLKIMGHLVDTIPESGQPVIDAALRGGAKMHIQFGPVPAFDRVELVMVEREGTRHVLTSLSLNMTTTQ